ncbi:MAG: SWIM zinc finger family protein [Gordonia sp. (in: high G+C Gram-positive bacteria)]
MAWTEQQVLAVAPDAASADAGRKLATPGPWSGAGSSDSLLWGSCQGSGSKPYQVSVDLIGPAYKCTCPSRKFPCKHAIALLLLWSSGAVGASGLDAAGADAPGFAAEWADRRAGRAAAPAAEADPQAQAARRAEREAKMDAGVEEFSRWLTDLARGGLADAARRPSSWWDAAAARLVDAQLPGLAERVRDTGEQGATEPAVLLEQVGVWWMLAKAWTRRALLPESQRMDLQTALGWTIPTATVRDGEVRDGEWLAVGSYRDESGRLAQQRTWLRAPDGEYLMTLDTAGPGQSLGVPQLAGARLRTRLGVYPGNAPRRVLFVDPPQPIAELEPAAPRRLGPGLRVGAALEAAARTLTTTPWRDRCPVTLDDVAIAVDDRAAYVVDPDGDALKLCEDTSTALLLAVTGGRADQVFGELSDGTLRVLTVSASGKVAAL